MSNNNPLYMILNTAVNEVSELLAQQKGSLTDVGSKSKYLSESNFYFKNQIKTRLDIVSSFRFSELDSKESFHLYESITLIAGVYHTLCSFDILGYNSKSYVDQHERYLNEMIMEFSTFSMMYAT